MTLPQPSLDDRTFADLVDEARSLIRTHQPEWTNHNPSDPGITLIELFAWLAEMLIYRCDQVPDRHRIVFLRLLNGPDWMPAAGASIEDEIAASVTALRARFRAVTAVDYEALALEASPLVARVLCLAQRDLAADSEKARSEPQPGHVSVLVLPLPETSDAAAAALRDAVRVHLEPRRLLTTRNVIAGPVWSPVAAEILVAPRHDVPPARANEAVAVALNRFLDPWRGGTDGAGWPFGRDVHVSELYDVLENLPEVDYVPDVRLSSSLQQGAARRVEAEQLFSDQGEQIGLRLAPHVLPEPLVEPAQITSSSTFVAVTAIVALELHPDLASQAQPACAAAQTLLRSLFHPLHGGPAGGSAWSITSTVVEQALPPMLPKGVAVVSVVLMGDPSHVSTDELAVTTVQLGERELVDLEAQVQVHVSGGP